MRIVSLIASSTEIVCALGMEEFLVGRSHECDYPPSVQDLPVCTAPKFRTAATSSEIDRQVKEILEQALSVYRVDAKLLESLQPTHIVTQTQCEVCAVSLREVEEAVGTFLGVQPEIVSLQPNALADVWTDIRRVAEALGAFQQGPELIARLQARMTAIEQRAQSLPRRRSVACMEWIEVVAANPEVILILPCGFDIVRTRQELPLLTRKFGWENLRAVQEGRVYLLDGNQYFNRPGPRLVESLEILAEIIHPEAFSFGHKETGWQRM